MVGVPIGHVVTPAPKTISEQHTCEDHDEGTVHLEHHENLAKGRSTVLVHKDFDDIHSASSDSLSPDWGEVWRSIIIRDHVFEEERSVTSSLFSSVESVEHHEYNVWNPMLEALCYFEVGVVLGALLDKVATGRIALACHFSLDVLCDKSYSLPVVTDNVSERNWSPHLPLPLPPYVVTECAHVGTLTIENEPALMHFVMDGVDLEFHLSLLGPP